MYIEEEEWDILSKERQLEIGGYYYFQRHGEEDWTTFNSYYSSDNTEDSEFNIGEDE